MYCQAVKTVREKVEVQLSNIAEMRRQINSAEDAVVGMDDRRRHLDDSTERLKQRLFAAEAKLERYAVKRHSLLVYAMVLYTLIS